jgi:hypothetical protein
MRLSSVLRQIVLIFMIISIGTVFDWFAHGLSPRFAVPEYYFPHKILYGTIIGSLALWIERRFLSSDRWLAFWVTLTVAILIQVRYAVQGYALSFVLLFAGIHFAVWFIPALLLFPAFRKTIRA